MHTYTIRTRLLTRLGSHSPFDVSIKEESVSIFVMFHMPISLTVATRDTGPRRLTWLSEMLDGYA